MKFSTKTRDAIRRRANGSCEVCGVSLRIYGQIHHRRPRGMGGSKQETTGSAANGLYVHQKCHDRIERNRANALDRGWLVSQYDEPDTVPVKLWYGWRLLTADGGVQMVNDAEGSLDLGDSEGAIEIVPDGVSADHSQHGSLTDAEFASNEISRQPF